MKRKLLVIVFVFIYGIASAQFTIWEDDFDDSEVSDWILVDEDGDTANWITRTNIQIDENNAIVDGTYKILGSYNIDLATGAPLGVEQKNWAITPAIDLSYYAGSMELILNAQKAIYDASNTLDVYASTTNTELSSFTLIGTIEIGRETVSDIEFKDYVLDISPLVGEPQVYLAFLTSPMLGLGYEIDKISITAARLGLGDIEAKKETYLKQNPVKENLQLQLGDTVNAEQAVLKIYNTTGLLVKESKYKDADTSIKNLSQGVYYLIIQDGNRIEKIKFIKE